MQQALFRQEAQASHRQGLYGDLVLSQPLPVRLLVAFLVLVTLLALYFLASREYARKVSVEGRLVPEQGLIELLSPAAGRVGAVFVVPGQQVQAGDPLYELELDHTLGSGQPLSESLLAILEVQARSLEKQLGLQQQLQSSIDSGQSEQLALLEQQAVYLEQMLERERELSQVSSKAVGRAEVLQQRNLLPESELDTLHSKALRQRQELGNLELELLQTRASLRALLSERSSDTLQNLQHRERLSVQLAENRQQRLRLRAEQRTRVFAPRNARVSDLLVKPGMTLTASQNVGALLPENSGLQAELLVPGTAIGFLNESQQVNIRFDAFPYQKFGVQTARVRQVSDSSQRLAAPEEGQASGYHALAELNKQTITAYGSEQPLKAGMRFSADVVLDRRSLLEWLLEPLFSIRGYGG